MDQYQRHDRLERAACDSRQRAWPIKQTNTPAAVTHGPGRRMNANALAQSSSGPRTRSDALSQPAAKRPRCPHLRKGEPPSTRGVYRATRRTRTLAPACQNPRTLSGVG